MRDELSERNPFLKGAGQILGELGRAACRFFNQRRLFRDERAALVVRIGLAKERESAHP